MVVYKIAETEFYVSKLLMKLWSETNLKSMKKSNSDRVYIVDGMERSGKSTWTFQQSSIIDPDMWKDPKTFVSRVCFDPEEFLRLAQTVKNGVIIFDEAFRGLSSRTSLSKVNKKMVQAMMEMGQNNNIVFIVLPRIFLLDIYVAMLRSHGLFHIYKKKNSKIRAWKGYNLADKNKIYQVGIRKGWSYPVDSIFKDNFYGQFPGGKKYEDAYLRKKMNAFISIDKEENKKDWIKEYKDFLAAAFQILKEEGLTYEDIAERFKQKKIKVSKSQIHKEVQRLALNPR